MSKADVDELARLMRRCGMIGEEERLATRWLSLEERVLRLEARAWGPRGDALASSSDPFGIERGAVHVGPRPWGGPHAEISEEGTRVLTPSERQDFSADERARRELRAADPVYPVHDLCGVRHHPADFCSMTIHKTCTRVGCPTGKGAHTWSETCKRTQQGAEIPCTGHWSMESGCAFSAGHVGPCVPRTFKFPEPQVREIRRAVERARANADVDTSEVRVAVEQPQDDVPEVFDHGICWWCGGRVMGDKDARLRHANECAQRKRALEVAASMQNVGTEQDAALMRNVAPQPTATRTGANKVPNEADLEASKRFMDVVRVYRDGTVIDTRFRARSTPIDWPPIIVWAIAVAIVGFMVLVANHVIG